MDAGGILSEVQLNRQASGGGAVASAKRRQLETPAGEVAASAEVENTTGDDDASKFRGEDTGRAGPGTPHNWHATEESVPGSPPVRGPGNDGIDAFCQQASESSFSIRCNAVYLAGDSTLDEADDIMSKFLALPTLSPPGSPKIRDELEGPSVPANAVSPADVYSIQTNDVFIPVDLEEQRSGAVEAPADFCFSSWDDENGCQRGNVSPLALTTTASLGRVAPTTEGESHATFHDHPDNEQPKLPPPVAFTIPTNPTGHCRKSHPPGSKRPRESHDARALPVDVDDQPPGTCSAKIPHDPGSRGGCQAWHYVDWAEGRARASPCKTHELCSSGVALECEQQPRKVGVAGGEQPDAQGPRCDGVLSFRPDVFHGTKRRPAPGWFRLVAGHRLTGRWRAKLRLALSMWRGVGASHRAEKALAAARHDRSLWLALKTRNTVLLTGYLMGSAWLRWCAVVREHRAAMAVAGYRAGLSHGCLGWGVVGGRRGLTRLLLRKWSLVVRAGALAASGKCRLLSRMLRCWRDQVRTCVGSDGEATVSACSESGYEPVALMQLAIRAWAHRAMTMRLLERAVTCACRVSSKWLHPAWRQWKGIAAARRRFQARAFRVFHGQCRRRMRSAWDTWTAACAPGPPGKSSQNGMPGGPSSAVALSTTGDDRVDLSEGSGGAANGFMVGSCTSPSKSASVRSCPAHPASLSRSTLIRHEVSDPLERHATTAAWAYPAVRPRITLKKKQLTSRPSSAVSGSSRRSAPQSASCTRATATSSRRRTEAARCSATAADRLSQAPEKFIGPLNAIISGTRGHGTRQPGDFSKLTVVQEAAAETQDVRGSCNHAGDRWDNLDASLLKAEIIKLELEANKKITEQNNRIRRLRDTVGALADGFWRELQRRAMAKAFDKWRRYAALAVISVIPYMQDGLECATPDNSSQASAELWSAERGSQPAELHVSLPSSPCQEPVHADHGMPATMATAGQLGGATCKGRQRRAGVGRGSHGSQGMAHNRTLRVGPPLQVSKQNTQPMPEKVPCQPAAKPRRSRGRHELVWYGDVPSSGSPSKTF